MPSHILMIDDCGRFAWIPCQDRFIAECLAHGWTKAESSYCKK